MASNKEARVMHTMEITTQSLLMMIWSNIRNLIGALKELNLLTVLNKNQTTPTSSFKNKLKFHSYYPNTETKKMLTMVITIPFHNMTTWNNIKNSTGVLKD